MFTPNEKLDAALEALREDSIETLRRWIRVPSLRADPEPGAPFGREVRRVLDLALEDVRRLGLKPRDIDGYCLDAEIGEGEDVVAVLAHLDVVPEGEGWDHDPYGAEIEGGRLVGRGTADDTGPSAAALFHMKAIRDAGIPLGRRCRLILGCDEECGMQDLAYYEKKIGLPAVGFSPDANFPLINTEKGITAMELVAPMTDARLLELASGTRSNVVPGKASALVAGDVRAEAAEVFRPLSDACEIETSLEGGNTRIAVTGVPAHASLPEKGCNAAKMLLAVLADLEIGGEPVRLLVEASGEGDRGVAFGISGEDAVSGPLTINLGLLGLSDGKLSVTYDCRYPVMFSGQTVRASVARRLAPAGFELLPGRDSVPHHVPESSELVRKLMEVYNGICGVQEKPFAIGGGTYARHLQEGVAFGMLFPGEPELEHQPNESISLESFARATRIYAYAILALCA